MLDTLFVYGTLMRTTDGAMHPLLLGRAEFLGSASIAGKLYLVHDYPGAIIIEGDQPRIHGEVYHLFDAEKLLPMLDEYEECAPNFPSPHEYQRLRRPIARFDGQNLKAWVYQYNLATQQLKQIRSGDYRNHLSNPS
jgi:gamma-glutamylcyclotransferase (GGCT)/AIG2-like uncharacterized protein YtfP